MFQTAQEKLLILGCGDIGLRLVHKLSADHYLIQGVRRREIHHEFPNFTLMKADLYQPSSINSILKISTPDVILVTMTPDERSDQAYKKAYVDTCQSLIEGLSLLQQKPRLILFVSSTSVYSQDDGSWVDELSITAPKTFSGKRLLEAEALLLNSEFPAIVVRFSGIYGPGRNHLIRQVQSGKISSSTSFTNRIHADDCASVLAHLIEKQKTQLLDDLYLASDDTPVPLNEIQTWIAKQLGVENFEIDTIESERSNKKISSQRLKKTGFEFLYRGYQQGYAELIKEIT